MAEVKVSNLSITNTYSANDRIVILTNTDTTPVLKTVTTQNLNLNITTPPATHSSNGIPGQFAYDNTNFYVCVSNNSWGKVSLTLSW